jgi:hypothetical protein
MAASYDNGLNTGFWDGFRPKRGLHWAGSEKQANTVAWEWFASKEPVIDPEATECHEKKVPTAMLEEL